MKTSSKTPEPHSYVVRIYRRTLRGIVGQVEDVQSGLVRSFRSVAELWRALDGPAADRPRGCTKSIASKSESKDAPQE